MERQLIERGFQGPLHQGPQSILYLVINKTLKLDNWYIKLRLTDLHLYINNRQMGQAHETGTSGHLTCLLLSKALKCFNLKDFGTNG